MRPDRAEMIRVRVIGRILAGERANAPPAPHILLQASPNCAFRLILVCDAAPQALACVRCNGGNQPLLAILSIGIAALILHPVDLMEAALQGLGFLEECLRPRFVTK